MSGPAAISTKPPRSNAVATRDAILASRAKRCAQAIFGAGVNHRWGSA